MANKLPGWILVSLWMAGCGSSPEFKNGGNLEPNYSSMRAKMVAEQLQGPGRDIKDPRVLAVMAAVPRHEFVPAGEQASAYADHPLPIGYAQTISQPYIVAYMTEKLAPKPTDRVLEIGTGSGYQAAVLSRLVAEVYTVEIIEALGKQATTTLDRLGCQNVKVKIGDGYLGWPEYAPFDAIIVTCAPAKPPQALIDQLKEGGRMVIPVGESQANQMLFLLEKSGGALTQRAVLPVRFVPMTGGGETPGR